MTETVTVELTRDELSCVWGALFRLEVAAWQDLYAAEGREKLDAEGRRPADQVQINMLCFNRPPDQDARLEEIVALRQKVARALDLVPAPERRAKEGAA